MSSKGDSPNMSNQSELSLRELAWISPPRSSGGSRALAKLCSRFDDVLHVLAGCAMSLGIARRRAAKAARRKKLLAERRALTQPERKSPLSERMQRLAVAPLDSCLMQDGLFERGNGVVILTRKTGFGSLAMAFFLLDVFCLGVKDTLFLEGDASEIDRYFAAVGETAPLVAVDPCYARKLLRDLVTYARTLGFVPHADYAALDLLFGDNSADGCDVTFCFGHDGKALYIPGPEDTPAQIRRRIEDPRRRRGDGAFDFLPLADDDDDLGDDFGAEDTPGYDPAEAPDPAEWLGLDEGERLNLVSDYHRSAGISTPNDSLHAVFHVIVENQVAIGDELPVRRAVKRLMAGGLDRHEALHAVASVLAEHTHDLARGNATRHDPNYAYNMAVERLTVESWRRKWEAEDEADGL